MKTVKSKFKILSSVIVFGLLLCSCNPENTKDSVDSQLTGLSGPYLGQKLPGTSPELFASGIISTELPERDFTISPDGTEIFYSIITSSSRVFRTNIVSIKQVNGRWTKPEVATFSGEHSDVEPYIQPDGKKLYFISSRPLEEGKENKYRTNMWYVNKTINGWSEPIPIGEPINGRGSVCYPSITKSGTMYFTRGDENRSEFIYRSKLVDGKYTEAELLPKEINWANAQFNTFISPDEDFLIVPAFGRKGGCGSTDYYVSFRDENDNWSELINLGCEINSSHWDYSPSMSPDGKYFFFHRDRYTSWSNHIEDQQYSYDELVDIHNGGGDIYWVDASVITDLNPFKKLQ